MQGKNDESIAFSKESLALYRQSVNFNETMNLIGVDIMQIKPFFSNFLSQI